MAEHVAEQFDTAERQRAAAKFGMWVFLASELLLFGGLFAIYGAYRTRWPEDFAAGVRENALYLGSLNTLLLLTSSLCVALGVGAVRKGRHRAQAVWTALAMLLGLAFLGFKFLEYRDHLSHGLIPGSVKLAADTDPGRAAFVTLYYTMTGLHALHVIIGLGVLGVCVFRGARRSLSEQAMEASGLYWHLVDVIWIFLWPLFYLTYGGR
ncbi:MAG: cytochrome c oxidase subunit 3 [Polyangiaceae bacterium]